MEQKLLELMKKVEGDWTNFNLSNVMTSVLIELNNIGDILNGKRPLSLNVSPERYRETLSKFGEEVGAIIKSTEDFDTLIRTYTRLVYAHAYLCHCPDELCERDREINEDIHATLADIWTSTKATIWSLISATGMKIMKWVEELVEDFWYCVPAMRWLEEEEMHEV